MGILALFLDAVASILDTVLFIYLWVVIISALLSWVNPDPYNPIVRVLRSLTEPVFYRIRRLMPFTMVGGLDLSPVVLLLGIQFARMFVVQALRQFAQNVGY
jgi:YggT family protein